jgi:hypothetical protein
VCGVVVGLVVPWLVLAALPSPLDMQRLTETSVAIVMPAALAIDCVLFVGVAYGLWRKRRLPIMSPPLSSVHPSEIRPWPPRFMQPRRGRAAS